MAGVEGADSCATAGNLDHPVYLEAPRALLSGHSGGKGGGGGGAASEKGWILETDISASDHLIGAGWPMKICL